MTLVRLWIAPLLLVAALLVTTDSCEVPDGNNDGWGDTHWKREAS